MPSTEQTTPAVASDVEGGNSQNPSEVEIVFETDDSNANPLKSKSKAFSKKASHMSISDDPFAPREGKALLWKNVNMTLVSCKTCIWYHKMNLQHCCRILTCVVRSYLCRRERNQEIRNANFWIMYGVKFLKSKQLPSWDQGRFIWGQIVFSFSTTVESLVDALILGSSFVSPMQWSG